jgi:N-acetyl-alpha-D-muramate 1-phosphate uridylyltransferase
MILAAGLGTRLRPLTDHTPKALVDVGGVPMLERVAIRLIEAGATRLIVNVHHHADQVERFLQERGGFGVDYRVSREEGGEPLETGGGLKGARDLFESGEPFFMYNVDVLTDLDLAALYSAHLRRGPLATLAVSRRETSRPLLFDEIGLYGRLDKRPGGKLDVMRDPRGATAEVGFTGVHVLSPEIFGKLSESGKFGITSVYLRLAGEGERILPYDASDASWMEVGTLERLEEARKAVPPKL